VPRGLGERERGRARLQEELKDTKDAAAEGPSNDYQRMKGGFTAHDVGQFNLTLQNDAHWTNELKSSVTDKWLGSHLASLKGGSNASNGGVIFQKNDKDITVDNYSGHTRAYWAHEADTPTVLSGGTIRIKDAQANSVFYLATSRDGVTAANEEAVLNALANKLYYENDWSY